MKRTEQQIPSEQYRQIPPVYGGRTAESSADTLTLNSKPQHRLPPRIWMHAYVATRCTDRHTEKGVESLRPLGACSSFLLLTRVVKNTTASFGVRKHTHCPNVYAATSPLPYVCLRARAKTTGIRRQKSARAKGHFACAGD